jgi:hypothetical protein
MSVHDQDTPVPSKRPRRVHRARSPEPPSSLATWVTRLRTCPPVPECHKGVARDLERRVLPGIAHMCGDRSADCQQWARVLTPPLVDVALIKLSKEFPKDARKGRTPLLRWHVGSTAAHLSHAIEWVTDLFLGDLDDHGLRDPLSRRVSRVYARVCPPTGTSWSVHDPALPSWQGQKRTGRRSYKLMLYVAYEEWVIRVFEKAFTAPEWRQLSTAEREHLSTVVLNNLEPKDRPSRPWPL